ncbi:hypothetical protein [Propionibacterium freudenreichii]|uniref:hypothetical protein n=1 Tax=Propionibacterium freudenreichii TaxID=1744 RepID=UPI00254C8C34|nr:hypothetical protein [Propionibacterium freudenreichii]MDK9661426.1 hypothetical protein [Propionibacterium freudenreichii]
MSTRKTRTEDELDAEIDDLKKRMARIRADRRALRRAEAEAAKKALLEEQQDLGVRLAQTFDATDIESVRQLWQTLLDDSVATALRNRFAEIRNATHQSGEDQPPTGPEHHDDAPYGAVR